MKNQKIIWSVVAVIVIIIIIVAVSHGSGSMNSQTAGNSYAGSNGSSAASNVQTVAPAVPVGTTTEVSATTKNYQNPELGFSVNYPATWGLSDSDSGPTFNIPTGGNTSILTLQAQVYFAPGTCAFPQVATSSIAGQSTLVAGSHSFKMIKVVTTAHSQSYMDEMYTLQQGSAPALSCYVFSFASTATSPVPSASQTVINNAAKAFTTMVQSFGIVTGPAGQSETAHPNGN